jgi:diacylglycerol kinase (ATP)
MRTCVIFNPHAGRGHSQKILERNRAWLPPHDLRATTGPLDGIRQAETAATEGYERIVALGGDGTAHEVANGILQSGRDVLFATWPAGSSNDYARTLGLDQWWAKRGLGVELSEMKVDVGQVIAGGQERFFINGCGIGFNGMVTLEAHKIQWLRGMPLYTLAFLRAMCKHFRTPRMQIEHDGNVLKQKTLSISFNLAQREGGFPVTWDAKLDDGLFDCFHAEELKRWQLVRYLPALMSGCLPQNHPHLLNLRAGSGRVESEVPLCIHVDGELFCIPTDNVPSATIRILPRQLRVQFAIKHLYGA